MKKNLLAVVLPVAAFVALAGTGFGAWIFSTASSEADVNSYSVTNAYTVGAIDLAKTDDTIVLDQTNPDFAIAYKTDIKVEEAVGGTHGSNDDASAYKDWVDNAAAKANITATYNFGVALGGNLETYLEVKSITRTTDNTVTNGADFTVDYANVGHNDVKTENYAIAFDWKTSAKPETMEAYKAMVTAVKTGTITLTAKLVKVAFTA